MHRNPPHRAQTRRSTARLPGQPEKVSQVRSGGHTGEEPIAVPLPDLALLVLADFEEGQGWNQRSWLLEAKQGHIEVVRHAGVLNWLAEPGSTGEKGVGAGRNSRIPF